MVVVVVLGGGLRPWALCRFEVNFMKGSDVVFHFNPRMAEQTIVRNTNLGGRWGPEERDGDFPFAPGRQFEVTHPRGTGGLRPKKKIIWFNLMTNPLSRLCPLVDKNECEQVLFFTKALIFLILC